MTTRIDRFSGRARHASSWCVLVGVATGVLVLGVKGAAAGTDCPDDFLAYAGTTDHLACSCTKEAAEFHSWQPVYGMGVYTGDSRVCPAARHVGAIGENGGDVTVIPDAGRSVYPGVTRNGVTSINHGTFSSSFRFASAAPAAPATPVPEPRDPVPDRVATSVSDCPDNFLAYAGTTEPLACSCSKEEAEFHSWQPVYGMGVYTGDSRVCPAARHVGAIGESGGDVTVIPDGGHAAYPGVTRNGVTSVNHGTFASSFRFASAPASLSPSPGVPAQAKAAASVSDCPDDFLAYAGTTEHLACSCTKEEAEFHSWQPVYGMGVYTGDSRVCPAARQVGAIGEDGGNVTVIPDAGRSVYPGVTRNGVISTNHGAFSSSFRFASAAAPAVPGSPTPAPARATATISDCPDNFLAYAGTTDPLACSCSKDAAEFHSWQPVYGMGVYTGDSRVCPAARQVGAIGEDGGNVTVLPDAGHAVYPGVTRNGVISTNHGASPSSFRFASVARAVKAPVAPVEVAPSPQPAPPPVQEPIAASLRDRGEVNLYVRFRTGSADLDPETLPVLQELLAAIEADPSLNLGLIGHTDNVGSNNLNGPLSYHRAEAVRFWLADHGVAVMRIAVDGRGFSEPLADNGTESGRATNRRVQAKRLR